MQKNAATIERIANLVRAQARSITGLPDIQIQLLNYFNSCNRYSNTLNAAAEFLQITKGTLSISISSLEDKGYLKRIVDTCDNRMRRVKLTTKAEKLLDKVSSSQINQILETQNCENLDKNLQAALITIQRNNNNKVFGVCHECRFFRKNALGNNHLCGLTKELLSAEDSLKICYEFEEQNL